MSAVESLSEPLVPAKKLSGPLLRTLVLCDLVDSTALIERLGDQRGAEMLRRHDRLARDLVQSHAGQEIDKSDGFLVMFERPVQAVAFALAYQRELHGLGTVEHLPLRARIGIHVGDVMLWDNAPDDVAHGAKPVEVEGLVKPYAARLAGLALPGQILASGVAANLAQRAHAELGESAHQARWINHGRYRFKGVHEPVQVYEIGEPLIAPFKAPPWSSKAHREVPWWRRPANVVVEAVLFAAAISAIGYYTLRSQPAIAFASRDWVVIGSLINLTSETRFDDAVQTAFRIGLEQSRYVNVVPDLQVRDALKRMDRPAGTSVDREVGSEIAQREGARALIVPTVAEIGGKVRVTMEVIDPHSQATVYSESAEGQGAESVLNSLDALSRQVRGRLGESLAVISSDAQPLPKVMTPSIDALRAYALGTGAVLTRDFHGALALFDQALQLDPGFAMAHLGKARIHLSGGDRTAALEALQKAMPLRDRLPPREALYFDALLATFRTPADMLEKWKMMGNLYPDAYFAHTNYALFAWQYMNAFDDAIAAARRAIDTHNSSLGTNHYLLATLYLGNDQFADAEREMADAVKLGAQGSGQVIAEIAAAQRRFDKAGPLAEGMHLSGVASDDVFRFIPRITIAADRGDFAAAAATATTAKRAADRAGALYERLYRGIELSVRSVGASDAGLVDALREFAAGEETALAREGDPDRAHAQYAALFAAYLLAHHGDADDAHAIVKRVGATIEPGQFPVVDRLHAVGEAEVLRARGDARAAAGRIEPMLDGSEPYLAHAALRDAYVDAGRTADALAQSTWLATHRGRAYAEFGSLYLQRPYIVALSDTALLSEAELASATDDRKRARAALAAFSSAWPNPPAVLAARAETLRAALASE